MLVGWKGVGVMGYVEACDRQDPHRHAHCMGYRAGCTAVLNWGSWCPQGMHPCPVQTSPKDAISSLGAAVMPGANELMRCVFVRACALQAK